MTPTTPSPISALLHRLNDATKPVDAADRNLIIRALSTAPTTGSAPDADEFCKAYVEEWQDTLKEQSDRIKELEADVAENDTLIDTLREQIAASASPAASMLTDEQMRHLRVTLGLLNGMGYPDEAGTIVAIIADGFKP